MRVATIQLAPMQQPLELQNLWIEIEHLIDRSEIYWQDLYTKDHFRDGILRGDIQLWLIKEPITAKIKAIILTQISKYPAQLVGEVILAAGAGLLENMRLANVMEEFAREFGVDFVLIRGRIGWKKPLEKLGYNMYQASFSKYIKEIN